MVWNICRPIFPWTLLLKMINGFSWPAKIMVSLFNCTTNDNLNIRPGILMFSTCFGCSSRDCFGFWLVAVKHVLTVIVYDNGAFWRTRIGSLYMHSWEPGCKLFSRPYTEGCAYWHAVIVSKLSCWCPKVNWDNNRLRYYKNQHDQGSPHRHSHS